MREVKVLKQGFIFCKFSLMILFWIAFIFKIKWIVILNMIILGLSALLKVQRAPMIVLYSKTIGKLIRPKFKILNENAMRFAHSLGFILALITVILLYSKFEFVGWNLLLVLAILKTISAIGFCPGEKIYVCMSKGGCCALSKVK